MYGVDADAAIAVWFGYRHGMTTAMCAAQINQIANAVFMIH